MILNEDYIMKNKIKKDNLILKKLEVGNSKLILAYYKDKDEGESQVKNNSLKLSLTIYNVDKKNILPKRSFNMGKDSFAYNNKDLIDKNKEIIVFSGTIKCFNCGKEFDVSRLEAEINNMSNKLN